jgi:hypothetical protein
MKGSAKAKRQAERKYRQTKQPKNQEIDDEAFDKKMQEAIYSCGRQAARAAEKIVKAVAQGTAASVKYVCLADPRKAAEAVGVSLSGAAIGAVLAYCPSDACDGSFAQTPNDHDSYALTAATTCVAAGGMLFCAFDYYAQLARSRNASLRSLEGDQTGDDDSLVETRLTAEDTAARSPLDAIVAEDL